MYEIRTQTELLLFYQYASADPTRWECLRNAKVEHATLGSGMILGYEPATDARREPKIRVLFDAPATPATNNAPKPLALPFLFEKALLKSLTVPSSVVEQFRALATQVQHDEVSSSPLDLVREAMRVSQTRRDEVRSEQHAESSPPLKSDWRKFQEIVKEHDIKSLYHFTDSRNLESIKRHGGLFSWWQCHTQGIRITAPGGNSSSQERDKKNDLQDYVRLSFNDKHPMMYVAQRYGRVRDVKILRIDPSVIYLEPTLFSNVNANDAEAYVGISLKSFERVKFPIATAERWDGCQEKKFFQAEVLVNRHVPLDLIKNL